MDILNTEKVMVFKGLWIQIHTAGVQKWQFRVLAVHDLSDNRDDGADHRRLLGLV